MARLQVGGQVPEYFVAASDAIEKEKNLADYVCDGVADEVEINAALTALPANGGRVVLSMGTFTCADVIGLSGSDVSLVGSGMNATLLTNPSTDVILLGDGASWANSELSNMHIRSAGGGGHVLTFDVGVSRSRLSRLQLDQANAAKSCIYARFTGGGVYDTLFSESHYEAAGSHSVPIVDIESDNAWFNTNTFFRIRFQGNGSPSAYHFRMVCTGANWNDGNTLSEINFEIPDAGAIFLEGANGTLLSNLGFFDITTTTDNLVYLDKNVAGGALNTRYTTLTNVLRYGGALGGGLFDLKIVDGLYTTITNSGQHNGIGSFDLGNKWCALVNCYATLTNYALGTVSALNSTYVMAATLRVPNSAAATTPGDCQNRLEVFDEDGNSLGFIAIYDAIT